MGRVLNLMAFVIFATTLFMRSVDPVIPQIATGLNVTPTTAALLSTGFALPYALIQPVLGALADMFSKTRLIAACMFVVGISTVACGFATNFETLMALRVIAGIAAGGVFPIALAVAGDRVPVQQRQVAIGRLLFAAMSGNLLGASGAGVIGDLVGWRGVFFVTGAIDLIALAVAIPGFRSMDEKPAASTYRRWFQTTARSSAIRWRSIVSAQSLSKPCSCSACFLIWPGCCVPGLERASIAGIVIAGFGIGGVIYTFMVAWLARARRRAAADGGGWHGHGLLSDRHRDRMPWPVEFANFVLLGFGFLPADGCIQVYVTELAPSARGSATAAHSMFFFLGQAAGPVIYGIGLITVGWRRSVRGSRGVDINRMDLRAVCSAEVPEG